MKVYMISNSAGLYSTGGAHPKWVPQGKAKIWRYKNHVSSHLSLVKTHLGRNFYINKSQYESYLGAVAVQCFELTLCDGA